MAKIAIEKIEPNENQPRKMFTGIESLAKSIEKEGLLEPILVRPVDDDKYEIIHGERRYRAVKSLDWAKIPANVKDIDEDKAYQLSVIENVQREDLSPIEEAKSFNKLQGDGLTQNDIADMIGKGQSYVSHKINLLKLPFPLQFFLQHDLLSENHIRQVKKLKNIYGEKLNVKNYDDPDDYPDEFMESIGENVLPVQEMVKEDWEELSEKEQLLFRILQKYQPEDSATWPMKDIPDEKNLNLLKAIDKYQQYVSKHTPYNRQWVQAAFWWCSQSYLLNMSVKNLSTGIENWKERFYSAATFVATRKEDIPLDGYGRYWPASEPEKCIYWKAWEMYQAYAEDLFNSSAYEKARDYFLQAGHDDFFEKGKTYLPLALRGRDKEKVECPERENNMF